MIAYFQHFVLFCRKEDGVCPNAAFYACSEPGDTDTRDTDMRREYAPYRATCCRWGNCERRRRQRESGACAPLSDMLCRKLCRVFLA